MACFAVAIAEAVITTVASKVIEKKEKKNAVSPENNTVKDENTRIPFSRKLKWLSNMLWGGSALLAFEHVWHGEVVPWFPFLTAASNPADAAEMLHEMATVGVLMCVTVTAVWLGIVGITALFEKRAKKAVTAENREA